MAGFDLSGCNAVGCSRPIRARGYCATHLQRLYRTGSVDTVRKTFIDGDLDARFWARVDRREAGCWIWNGSKSAAGYGQVGDGGRIHYAHRIAHELLIGPIPEGYQVDHLCRVRACVNPAHLEAVTQQENIRRQFAARTA